MKTALICLPANKINDLKLKNEYKENLKKHEYNIIDSFFHDVDAAKAQVKETFCLGKRIEDLSYCDSVLFGEGWENDPMCIIENTIANLYGLEILYDGDIK